MARLGSQALFDRDGRLYDTTLWWGRSYGLADSQRQLKHDDRPLLVGVREPVQADFSAPYLSGHDATRSHAAAAPGVLHRGRTLIFLVTKCLQNYGTTLQRCDGKPLEWMSAWHSAHSVIKILFSSARLERLSAGEGT